MLHEFVEGKTLLRLLGVVGELLRTGADTRDAIHESAVWARSGVWGDVSHVVPFSCKLDV